MSMRTIEHLGDGVYVYFDGYGVELRANHHENPTDRVYLEPAVYHALVQWVESIKEHAKNDQTRTSPSTSHP